MPGVTGGDRRGGVQVERRRADAEQLLWLLVESVKDYAIFMLDPTGIIMTWNPGAERLKGYSAGEIIGRSFSVFYAPSDIAAGEPERSLQRALAEGRVRDEGWRVRKDGTLFWADVVLTAVYDGAGQHRGFAKVTRDLTERRRAEEERLKLAHAEEAVRLREEFMSIAAHELRTPLNALRLQIIGLKVLSQPDRYREFDRAGVAKKAERLLQMTDRLGNLIARLLDASRISSGRMSLDKQRMDLVASTRDVIAALEGRTAASGVSISFRGPNEAVGHWDPLRLEQVVYNLLENAIEHGEGAPIEVSIDADEMSVSLDVADQGPGIREEDCSRIFERFSGGGSKAFGKGLGLGLYISRAIVEEHGGEIQLQPADGGAHFRVRLPKTAAIARDANEED